MSEYIQMFPTNTIPTNKSKDVFVKDETKTSFLWLDSVGRFVWIPFISLNQKEEDILTIFYISLQHF